MSDFSTIFIAADCLVLPEQARGLHFQSKDMPDHETESACIGGDIEADGLFVRHDGLCNPWLSGWARLGAYLGAEEVVVRFERGYLVEAIAGRSLPAGEASAAHAPNRWGPRESLAVPAEALPGAGCLARGD